MTTCQTLCQTIAIDYDDEMKNTRQLLERVPLDDTHRDYKPHEKSMSLEILATHLAEIPSWLKLALDSEVFVLYRHLKPLGAVSSEELLAIFAQGVDQRLVSIAGATNDDMEKSWTL